MARRYIGGSRARTNDVFSFSLPEELITPDLADNTNISDQTLHFEYTRMRDIAMKRLKRMEGKPEARETASQYQNGFPTIKELKKMASNAPNPETELRRLLSHNIGREARFLSARRGSLSGIRAVNKEVASKLKKASKKTINIAGKDLSDFGRFMNAMKKAYHYKGRRGGRGPRDYASDQFARMWSELNEKGSITEKGFREALKDVLAELEDEENAPTIESRRRSERTRASSVFAADRLDPRTAAASRRRR